MNLSENFTPVKYSQTLSKIQKPKKLTVPGGATCAVMQAHGDSVTIRDDGTPPTAGNGIQISPGSIFEYSGDLSQVQVTSTSPDGSLFVAYYKHAVGAPAKADKSAKKD